jgi:hypothetical protein
VEYNFLTEIDAFIDNFSEELIFNMHNDASFEISLLKIPEDFRFKRNADNILCMSLGDSTALNPVSEARYKEARKIFKNPQNAVACIYSDTHYMVNGKPIMLINFVYCENKDNLNIELYKKVIKDYLEIKNIRSLRDFRKIHIENFNHFKSKK